jgi:hypothetical protein
MPRLSPSLRLKTAKRKLDDFQTGRGEEMDPVLHPDPWSDFNSLTLKH